MSEFLNDPAIDEFRSWLQSEFSRRCRINARYSLRSFAVHLELHSSTLSQILSGKRRVSRKLIHRIYEQIGQPGPLQNAVPQNNGTDYVQMQNDAFAMISDWYHLAILDLAQLKGFKSQPTWIARKLSISQAEASLAIRRLLRMGLLKEKNGKLIKAQAFYTNYAEGVSSTAHKEYQRQIINKALLAIDFCAPEKKDITGMTIAANSEKLEGAKKMIKQFRRELCAYMEDGQADSVYHLALQLYPVTSFENEGKNS